MLSSSSIRVRPCRSGAGGRVGLGGAIERRQEMPVGQVAEHTWLMRPWDLAVRCARPPGAAGPAFEQGAASTRRSKVKSTWWKLTAVMARAARLLLPQALQPRQLLGAQLPSAQQDAQLHCYLDQVLD